MRLGTCLPGDESAQVDGRFNIAKAADSLAKAGIRGCLTNFTPDETAWETSSRELEKALRNAGVTLMEYNTPFLVSVASRDGCASTAKKVVRLLEIAESIGCLNVVTCVANVRSILPDPMSRSRQYRDTLKEICLLIAEEAGRLGLRARLLLELVYTTVTWCPEVLAQFIDEVGSPNVQGHMDIANCLTFDNIFDHAGFIKDAFAVLGDRIHSAHIKDVAPAESYFPGLTEALVGEGVMDNRTYLECLGKMPVDFPAIIEHMHSMEDIKRSYERIKAIADELKIPVWNE